MAKSLQEQLWCGNLAGLVGFEIYCIGSLGLSQKTKEGLALWHSKLNHRSLCQCPIPECKFKS